jgi:hypothetical protein
MSKYQYDTTVQRLSDVSGSILICIVRSVSSVVPVASQTAFGFDNIRAARLRRSELVSESYSLNQRPPVIRVLREFHPVTGTHRHRVDGRK